MVFDTVVSSSVKVLRNDSPFVSEDEMTADQNQVFLLSPFFFFDIWVKMVVPSLSALLSLSVFEMLGNFRPTSRTLFSYNLHQLIVLFHRPSPFGLVRKVLIKGSFFLISGLVEFQDMTIDYAEN